MDHAPRSLVSPTTLGPSGAAALPVDLLSNLDANFGNELGTLPAPTHGSTAALDPDPALGDSALVASKPGASQRTSEGASEQGLRAIQSANQVLQARTADQLQSAIVVLFEQRDRALVELGNASANAEHERQRLNAEHDRFVAFLMEEHERKLAELQTQLARAHEALSRRRVFALSDAEGNPSVVPPGQDAADTSNATREQLKDLRRLLEMAYTELDEQKEIVARLEQERDAAICAADDARVAIYGELETARDQLNALQDQLEDAQRQLEEARDQAREEAHSLSERLHDADRELDERRAEVARLRERIHSLTQEIQVSHPPPPPATDELSKARDEVQRLRRQLIDTKRQLSKLTREYASLKTQRVQLLRGQGQAKSPALAVSATTLNEQTPAPAEAGPSAFDE